MTLNTEVRNSTLQDLFPMLTELHAAKLDAVVPATAIRSEGAVLRVKGIRVFGEADIRPTAIMDGHIASRLDIPLKYVRRMRAERPDLYDANVNGWLHGLVEPGWAEAAYRPEGETIDTARTSTVVHEPDGRRFLLRTFSDPDGGEGIGRALLSDRYGPIEHIDALCAALEGIKESGVECKVVRANLSESRMSVRFAAPGITALMPALLKDYRPSNKRWTPEGGFGYGYKPGTEPVVFAGFDVDNSETGGGAFNVRPVITVEICTNGMKLDVGKLRRVHVGGRLEDGPIQWSEETQERSLALITSQTKDTVTAFLDQDFLTEQIQGIEAKAGKALTDANATVQLVAKTLNYSEVEQAGILAHFISGGQMTAGGVLNAVTSYAQEVTSPDQAFDLEGSAMQALEIAYASA